MTAPLWQAGHLYLPGDIVQPITAPATTPVAITNPGFETGTASGWTLGTATTVSTADKFTGTYSIQFSGAGGITDTVQSSASAVQPGQSITARCMYQQGAASAGHNGGRVMLVFYTAGMVAIGSPSLGTLVDSGSGGAWGQSTVTATAPATAAFVKVGIRVNRTNGNPSWADDFAWNHVAQAPAGLVFKAVQANAGTSGTSEPAWPNTVGLTVVDNQVTWEAIAATRVEWTASPILVSGATQPTWPTQIGDFIADGSIKWEAFSRRVEDENCPNSKVVAIVGSKVFAADRDIARFCATANPLDWTTERDAGYLPLGLQQANANDFDSGVFNQYRSNFVAFNASSFQNWQADPDPSAMALLDQMDGVGSTWQQAAQPVANDLFYLAALGVRTVGIAGGSTNLQAGDVGMPIDPLVKEAMRIAVTNGSPVRSTYYPSSGQYWLAFADFPPPALSLAGNVPNGNVGTAVSGAYTVSGGLQPYGPVTVLSGTFPPGLTLNPDGSYSGAYTTAGSYSWTLGVTDSTGATAQLVDSATVAQHAVYIASANNAGKIYTSDKGLVWSLSTFVTAPSVSGNTIARGIWDFGNVLLVSVGNNPYGVFWSIDGGVNWTQAVGIPSTIHVQAIAKVGSRLVAQHPSNSTVYVSDDNGVNWSSRATASTGASAFNVVARGGTLQLSDSSGTVQTSTNQGDNWTLQSPYAVTSLLDMTVTPTTFLGVSRTNNDHIRLSTDGTKNTVVAVDWPGRNISTNVSAIWYDGSRQRVLAALSNGNSIYSDDDGFSWLAGGAIGGTPNTATTQAGWADNGISFVLALGSPNRLFISQDGGATWSQAFDLAGAAVVAITSQGLA